MSRSINFAVSGKCSQTRTPGSFVAIDPKGPRISEGASGFGSHMSRWLGPPESQIRITLVFRVPSPAEAAVAWRRNSPGTERPARPESPVCRNPRPRRPDPDEIAPCGTEPLGDAHDAIDFREAIRCS